MNYKIKLTTSKIIIIILLFIVIIFGTISYLNYTEFDIDNLSRPTYSNDGNKILFSAKVKNKYHILLLDLKTNEIIRITNKGSFHSPKFSNDEKKIVCASFVKRTTSEIFIMDSNGDNIRQLTISGHNNRNPFFSRNDKIVYFTRILNPYRQHPSGRTGFDIYSIDLDSNNEERVTDEDNYSIEYPELHPFENKINYVVYISRYDEIENEKNKLNNTFGKKFVCYDLNNHKMISLSSIKQILHPILANNGKIIYYYGGERDYLGNKIITGLYKIDIDKQEPILISGNIKTSHYFSISKNDEKLVFLSYWPYKIMEINTDGSNLHEIKIDEEEIFSMF